MSPMLPHLTSTLVSKGDQSEEGTENYNKLVNINYQKIEELEMIKIF